MRNAQLNCAFHLLQLHQDEKEEHEEMSSMPVRLRLLLLSDFMLFDRLEKKGTWMSRRIFRLLSSVGLSIFFLFTFAGTSIPASAHTISSRPNTIARVVVTKSPSSVTPHLGINTNVVCTPRLYNGNLSAWTNTKNGPASYGCGGNAWQINTPTDNGDIYAQAVYDMGVVTSLGNYSLRAFITAPANAAVNYDMNVGGGIGIEGGRSCVFNQSTALIGWNTICTFSTGLIDIGTDAQVYEYSGQVHHGVMSASAIQFLPH